MQTQKFIRKPFEIEAVQVTEDNMGDVAVWCQGEIETEEGGAEFIKVRVHHPLNDRQTKAFVGDWVLYANKGFKVYTGKAFKNNFDELSDGPPQLQQGTDGPVEELLTTTEPADSGLKVIHDVEVAPGVTATTVDDIDNPDAAADAEDERIESQETTEDEEEEYDPSDDDVKYRDAITGKYVAPEYAEQNPDTTVAETE